MGFNWSKVDDPCTGNMSQSQDVKGSQDSQVAPDSTTHDRLAFGEGEHVLLHEEDGLIYFGTVVKVCQLQEQCLIHFEDDHTKWANFRSLRKVKPLGELQSRCIVCKSTHSTPGNLILPCHYCRRGYHQNCHQPTLPDQFAIEQAEWMCTRCVDRKHPKQAKVKKETRNDHKTRCSALPYNLSSLRWNKEHTANEEQVYCYCGKNGEWYKGMLQCNGCRQWFHDYCISILKAPLLFGDRFFLFKCSVCNQGEERVFRLSDELTLPDIAHIALYNLTMTTNRKYHDLDKNVAPFVEQHWDYFKPSVDMPSSVELRHKFIVLTLPRFACGGEFKKKKSMWGLRTCSPPDFPSVLSTRALDTLKQWNCDVTRAEKKPKKVKQVVLEKLPTDGQQRTLRVRQQCVASEERETIIYDDNNKKRKRQSEDGGPPSETSCDEISTLDLFIPPPSDFEGANNPFASADPNNYHNNYSVRPFIKKRLSEKDIRITKNGLVKRKRLVKKCKRQFSASTTTTLLFNNSKSETNSRESITNYFGVVAEKLASGDAYAIYARRVLPNGESQFLIQWDV